MLGIVLGLSAAWIGSEPSLNQPRPQTARPVINVVVPIAYWDEQVDATFVPPAPLPEFFVEEFPQLRFEFSQLESCSDSDEHPPAPPAELEWTPCCGVASDKEFPEGLACDAEEEKIPFQSAIGQSPANGPQTAEELHHLRSAIEHLQQAGMTEMATQLKQRYRAEVTRLHTELQNELEAKEIELARLRSEVQRLKAALSAFGQLESQRTGEPSAANPQQSTILGLKAENLEIVPVPEPSENEQQSSSIRVINPAFYFGEVPQHIQENWDRAMKGDPARRISNTESPKWVAPPPTEPQTKRFDGQGQKFHILQYTPDDSFPRISIEPPAELDDSGIYLKTLPHELMLEENRPTPEPKIHLHLRRSIPAKPELKPTSEKKDTKPDPET